jgi:hypothetical protein
LTSNGSNKIWPSATISGDARPGFIAIFWKIEASFHQRPERSQEIWIISLQLRSRASFVVEILRDMLEKLRKAYLDNFLWIGFLSMRARGTDHLSRKSFEWVARNSVVTYRNSFDELLLAAIASIGLPLRSMSEWQIGQICLKTIGQYIPHIHDSFRFFIKSSA